MAVVSDQFLTGRLSVELAKFLFMSVEYVTHIYVSDIFLSEPFVSKFAILINTRDHL